MSVACFGFEVVAQITYTDVPAEKEQWWICSLEMYEGVSDFKKLTRTFGPFSTRAEAKQFLADIR